MPSIKYAFVLAASATLAKATNSYVCPVDNGEGYVASDNSTQFIIECGIDRHGADMKNMTTSGFDECIDQCATTPGCVDVSWIPEASDTSGSCYLKAEAGTPTTDYTVWAARLAYYRDVESIVTCPDSDREYYTSNNGREYKIECNTDYYDSDIIYNPIPVDNLQHCIVTCENHHGCVDVTFNGTSCYLKDSTGLPYSKPGSSSAKCVSGCDKETTTTITSVIKATPYTTFQTKMATVTGYTTNGHRITIGNVKRTEGNAADTIKASALSELKDTLMALKEPENLASHKAHAYLADKKTDLTGNKAVDELKASALDLAIGALATADETERVAVDHV